MKQIIMRHRRVFCFSLFLINICLLASFTLFDPAQCHLMGFGGLIALIWVCVLLVCLSLSCGVNRHHHLNCAQEVFVDCGVLAGTLLSVLFALLSALHNLPFGPIGILIGTFFVLSVFCLDWISTLAFKYKNSNKKDKQHDNHNPGNDLKSGSNHTTNFFKKSTRYLMKALTNFLVQFLPLCNCNDREKKQTQHGEANHETQ